MNKTGRAAAIIKFQANPLQSRASFLHCTSISERKRRTHWDSEISFRSSPRILNNKIYVSSKSHVQKFNNYARRLQKQSLWHNVGEFAEHLFKSWKDMDEYDIPSSQGGPWFRRSRDDGFKRGNFRNRRSRTMRREFEFCDGNDDVGFETIFRSAFGGNGHFVWYFTDDEPWVRNSSAFSSNYRYSSRSRHQFNEEYDSSDSEKPVENISSDRLALGLSASGPLSMEDVKNAYRLSALKWHPDRHQGSSKIVAEEKFKLCSAAYQSLCDKLAEH